LRIVLDTNVVISALLWRGKPYLLLEAIHLRSDVHLVSSAALLQELADVLTRPSATKRLALIGKTVHEVLADYVEAVELIEPAIVPRVVPSDADDDHVIAAAVAAGAALIVTGDSDLLSMGSHQGIEIVSAAMAIEPIAASQPMA
jgi:putative PIN family toxin of toxin-antitoxin system